jgi:hypothetical protein
MKCDIVYPPDSPIESDYGMEHGLGAVGVNMGVPFDRPYPQEVSLSDVVEQMHELLIVLILDGRQEGTKSTTGKKQLERRFSCISMCLFSPRNPVV